MDMDDSTGRLSPATATHVGVPGGSRAGGLQTVSNEPAHMDRSRSKPYRAQEFTVGMDHERLVDVAAGRYAHKGSIEPRRCSTKYGSRSVLYRQRRRGTGEKILGEQYPAQPKPERPCRVELRVRRRLANNWSLNTSRLLEGCTEITPAGQLDENGRNSPNVIVLRWIHMSFDKPGRDLRTLQRPPCSRTPGYDRRVGDGNRTNFLLGRNSASIQARSRVPGFQGSRRSGRTRRSPTDTLWHESVSGTEQCSPRDASTYSTGHATGSYVPIPDAIPNERSFLGGPQRGRCRAGATRNQYQQHRLDPRFQQPSAFQVRGRSRNGQNPFLA